jgi:hypothetical protein
VVSTKVCVPALTHTLVTTWPDVPLNVNGDDSSFICPLTQCWVLPPLTEFSAPTAGKADGAAGDGSELHETATMAATSAKSPAARTAARG